MSTTINVPVINNSKNPLPKYETTEAAGMDLRASLTNLSTKFLFNAYIENNGFFLTPEQKSLAYMSYIKTRNNNGANN